MSHEFSERLMPPVSRRTFVKSAAFLGGAALAGGALAKFDAVVWGTNAAPEGGVSAYDLAQPENVLYSVCLMCNTRCPIKAKFRNGVLVKIDGNPYAPSTLMPWIDYSTSPQAAVLVDGKLCPKGQAGVQAYYDPYRLRRVLKRAGPRGSNRWTTIPFEQAVEEIVNGGYLFKDIGEDRYVPGLKEVLALRDPKLASAMAADVALIRARKLTVEEFKRKYSAHLQVLIDPDHPDLGPKNNQFVFLAGRIQAGRAEFAQRFTVGAAGSVNWYEHTSICELSHHVAYSYVTAQYAQGQWKPGPKDFKPNFTEAEFVIFWGTGAFEANFGPTPMSQQITDGLVERNFRFAVIDPRLSKTAAKAWRWIPVEPGGDLPLAMAMIRWILEHRRHNEAFLANANRAAAHAKGEKSWTTASWLVNIGPDGTPGPYVRASDLSLPVLPGKDGAHLFVVLVDGHPKAVDPYDETTPVVGDLDVDTVLDGKRVRSALNLLKEEAFSRPLSEWAAMAGVDPAQIEELADEFTSHGRRAAIDFYRGPVKHWNGYYASQAIITLNLLVGNPDWRGGLVPGGGGWDAMGGKNTPYDMAGHPEKLTAFGVKLTREGAKYQESTLFSGYPAVRPWFPFTANLYHEVLPAAKAGYPYPVKIVWLHMGNPALLVPGNQPQVDALQDVEAIPLIIADDIVLGDSTLYADYVFPDTSYLESWGFMPAPTSIVVKNTGIRQPVAPPIPETVTVFGQTMPISMEAIMLALAEKLGLSGFGKDALGPGLHVFRPEDFYLRAIVNIAVGSGPDDSVPEAQDAELELFLKARRHLPESVFDPEKWKTAVGEEHWRRVVYLLNRGGRFEPLQGAYTGEHVAHSFGKLWSLYVEPVATSRDSMSGKALHGLPRYEPPAFSDGTPIPRENFPFNLSTYKEIFGAKRTVSSYWSQLALLPENFVLMNARDARRLGLEDGVRVRLVSVSNPDGVLRLGPLGQQFVEGKVRIIQGIRPGTVSVCLSYGHWGYGAADALVDGVLVRGDRRRAAGLSPNPVMLLDRAMETTPVTDPIGGSASFFDTRVRIVRV
jgi:anaerobic selenocysteine-containing dehydrogenase